MEAELTRVVKGLQVFEIHLRATLSYGVFTQSLFHSEHEILL
jgi:hypothetical protein